jgi:hypothetical protein
MPPLAATKRPFDRDPAGNALGAAEQDGRLCRRLAGKGHVKMRRKMVDPWLVPDHIANTDKRLHDKKTGTAATVACQKVVLQLHDHGTLVDLQNCVACGIPSCPLVG